MTWFNDLCLRAKVLTAFGAVLLVMAAGAGVGTYGLFRATGSYNRDINSLYATRDEVNHANALFLTYDKIIEDVYLFDSEPDKVQPMLDQLTSLDHQISASLTRLSASAILDADELKDVAHASRVYADYQAASKAATDRVQAEGDPYARQQAAAGFTNGKDRPVSSILDDLSYRITQQTANEVTSTESNVQLLVPIISAVLAVSMLLGVSVALQKAERKRAEQAFEHLAFHDALTGLPNRALFVDRLELARAKADRQGTLVAVLFLDLDNFKVVNDSLGHSHGDALLVAVAQRLAGCLRSADTAARLGGDEFAVLLEDVAGESDAMALSERIAGALSVPFNLQDREIVVSASIGVAVTRLSDGGGDVLREADLAMYRAKADGKARSAVFDVSLESRAMERLELESDLRRALDHSELQVHYQPIVALGDGSVAGFEALLRWNHPARGAVQPLDFIPVAEDTGLIIPIGKWVIEQACLQTRRWQAQLPRAKPLMISVNLSARQLQDSGLAETVARAVQQVGLDPACLELEITESVVMQDAEATHATLRALKAIGIRLAIDDFGTGYSSLSYLKRFPVDTLKIDRSFVDGLGHARQDTAIVRSVAALGRALDLAVTAEGVETPVQLALLEHIQCDNAQGYLFSRPMSAADMTTFLTHVPEWERSKSAA